MFVSLGTVLLLAGRKSGKFVVPWQGQPGTQLQRATIAVCVGLGLALEFGFHWLIHVLGYR
jgi:hypothetical protein